MIMNQKFLYFFLDDKKRKRIYIIRTIANCYNQMDFKEERRRDQFNIIYW